MMAAYAMRGRMQAALLAGLFAALAMALPPLMIISTALVGLVTLRLGGWRGLEVVGGATLLVTAIAALLPGNPVMGLASLLFWVPVLLLGVLLRYSVSFSLTLQVALLFGLIPPLLEWWWLPEQGWQQLLEPLRQALTESKALAPDQVTEVMNWLGIWMTAFMAGGLLLQISLGLLLARGWQARLYHPGGFRQEFHALRVSPYLAYLATLAGLLMLWGPSAPWALLRVLALLLLVLFFFQGLAVLHALLAKGRSGEVWLLGLYALLLFALPYMAVAVAATGYADVWWNFRKLDDRLKRNSAGDE